jgi:hypothetical protein
MPAEYGEADPQMAIEPVRAMLPVNLEEKMDVNDVHPGKRVRESQIGKARVDGDAEEWEMAAGNHGYSSGPWDGLPVWRQAIVFFGYVGLET